MTDATPPSVPPPEKTPPVKDQGSFCVNNKPILEKIAKKMREMPPEQLARTRAQLAQDILRRTNGSEEAAKFMTAGATGEKQREAINVLGDVDSLSHREMTKLLMLKFAQLADSHNKMVDWNTGELARILDRQTTALERIAASQVLLYKTLIGVTDAADEKPREASDPNPQGEKQGSP